MPVPIRKPISLTSEAPVVEAAVVPGSLLPLMVKPTGRDMGLAAWLGDRPEWIASRLDKHGAILFRSWQLSSAEEFQGAARAAAGELINYTERSSPRSDVAERIYTSTDYPAERSIFPHNEHSYAKTFPLKLFFFCAQTATSGGETPLADVRNVLARIPRDIQRRFQEKHYMYVRNYGDGCGLPWQVAFQTSDRSSVEEYCRKADILCEWRDDGRLRTRQIRPAFAAHPRSGELLWFNHITFFHWTTLEPAVRSVLLNQFPLEDLPNNTYYGDGSAIEPEVVETLRDACTRATVTFRWERGDLVLIDNMLTAHARTPFTGPRKIWFAMAEPITRNDLP